MSCFGSEDKDHSIMEFVPAHQAISYIHENFQKDLNMAVVSNHISMNYSLFSYAFKQYYSPKICEINTAIFFE